MAGKGVPAEAPPLGPEEAIQIVRRDFGLEPEGGLRAVELPGDRDRNFKILRAGSPAFVLKISRSGEDPELLDLQERAIAHAAHRMERAEAGSTSDRRPLLLPESYATPDGSGSVTVQGADGSPFNARLLRWIPGVLLADARPRLPRLLEDLGSRLGALDRALEDFRHPAADRAETFFPWDLARGVEMVEQRLGHFSCPGKRALIRRHLRRFRDRTSALLDDLPRQVIHGDANDHNVLVRIQLHPGEDVRDSVHVAGILDFGDVHRGWRVAEAAVASAYAILGTGEPLRTAARIVAGYHRARPLTEAEVEVLFPLCILRLCVSVSMSAERRRTEPENAYLRISEAPAWSMLCRLDEVSLDEAHYRLRHACGMAPVPRGERVRACISREGRNAAPVVEGMRDEHRLLFLDFSVGSLEHTDVPLTAGAEEWTRAIFQRMEREGARVGVGRWGEPRHWYTGGAFQSTGPRPRAVANGRGGVGAGAEGLGLGTGAEGLGLEPGRAPTRPEEVAAEPRTVHMGVDLFVEPATPVRSPLAGRVHTVADNDLPQDYGPTLILEHDADGTSFFTLYGHLDPEVLKRWTPGDEVERGERIAAVGAPPRNGGWAPHLHFQVITDLLDKGSDFPGVAAPDEWGLWSALSPDPNALLRIPALEPSDPLPDAGNLLTRRRRLLGENLGLSYSTPLVVVRGSMQTLYDSEGRGYLDGRNNVAHVGHAHPRVAAAAGRQEAVLDTNTRYLHPARAEYVERLLALLPDPLSVCWLVCSGSEANELALRIARAYTGTLETLVLDGAYHGNTGTLTEISPYKQRKLRNRKGRTQERKRGTGEDRGAVAGGPASSLPPPWMHEVPMPDPYRGSHRTGAAAVDAADFYVARVIEVLDRLRDEGRGPPTFIAEPIMGCGGQIVPPAGFLDSAYRHVREAGGVTIADEVQVGFGRVGTHRWAFEAEGVVPDIVTLGKPMGNGYPLAAVVTTPEVAAAFGSGIEYFNTFGGNPVACRVGLAVLDVLEEEELQAHALDVGLHLAEGLEALRERHPLVGDVRGRGLFLGVELVTDREARTPAPAHARYVVERLRDHRILIGRDGLDENVLVLKPPLPFGRSDADRLLGVLDGILGEHPLRVDASAEL